MPLYLVPAIRDKDGTPLQPDLPEGVDMAWSGNVPDEDGAPYLICTETGELDGVRGPETGQPIREVGLEEARRYMRNDLGLPEADLETGWGSSGKKAAQLEAIHAPLRMRGDR